MAESKVAPRRTPFELGTKMMFVQASPPPDWVQDLTVNDKFLRVMSSGGGGTGSATGLSTTYTDPTHTHSIPSHTHSIGSHYHDATHKHALPDCTQGLVDFPFSAIETSVFGSYEVKQGGAWYTDRHIRTVGGSNNEGQHDHEVEGVKNGTWTGLWSGNTSASTDNTNNDGSDTSDSPSPSLNHSHTINSNFRPKYKDVIIARIYQ